MKAASLHEIKKELLLLSPQEVVDLCLKVARSKKDSKELLSYLLFDARDEMQFIAEVKTDIDLQFEQINTNHLYFAKKTLRKILRGINKYSKYSGKAQTEAELLLYFLQKLRKSRIAIEESAVLINLYGQQVKKIKKALSKLHEDLQYDYEQQLKDLN